MNDELDLEIERTLFAAALELSDPALREAFLDKTCAADPALRARLGAAGRQRAARFSTQAMARGTESVYERALARRGRRA